MEPRNVEVVDVDRRFQKFVLNLLNNYIFAVDEDKDISRSEMDRIRPTFDRGIEGMPRRGYDLLTLDEDMHQFVRFVDVGLHDGTEGDFSGFLIPGPYPIARLNLFNRLGAFAVLHKRSRNKAIG